MHNGDSPQHDPLEEFEQAMRHWAARPAQTPPQQAARQVDQRLPAGWSGRPRWTAWQRWAAAVLVLTAATATFLWRTTSEQEKPVSAELQILSVASLDEDTILLWLDAETPLYLILNPPQPEQGEKP